MNYEKAYKEALERAKESHIDGLSLHQPVKDVIEHIFPELAESEDEKIRKWIRKELESKYVIDNIVNNRTADKAFAWLEKQGKKSNWKPSKEEMDALYGLAYITNKMNDKKVEAITKLYQDLKREFFNGASYENMFPSSPVDFDINVEKQGEQKITNSKEDIDFTIYYPLKNGNGKYECIPYSFYGSLTSFSDNEDLIDFLRNCFYTKQKCEDWIKKQDEQRPSWNEDDEKNLNTIINVIHGGTHLAYENEIDWLKSLKYRIKGE